MSKKLKARELMWMTLPAVLLGGAAWWFGSGGEIPWLQLQNPRNSNPLRVEFPPFKKAKLSPLDVSRGFDWAVETYAEVVGEEETPWNFQKSGSSTGVGTLRLVYRRGTEWTQVPLFNGKRSCFEMGIADRDGNPLGFDGERFKVDLADVPRDAQEVRLRGSFEGSQQWRGTMPPNWKSQKKWINRGSGEFAMATAPKYFDLKIKGPNEPVPVPHVSHAPQIKFLDARWFRNAQFGQSYQFATHLRYLGRQDRDSSFPPIGLSHIHLFDAKGHPIELYEKDGKGARFFLDVDSFSNLRSNLAGENGAIITSDAYDERLPFSGRTPANQIVVPLWDCDCTPHKGWAKTAFPLTFEATIEAGMSWPLKVRATIEKGDKMEDYGASK